MSEIDFSQQPVNTRTKGLGPVSADARMGDIRQQGWNILREDVSLPVAVLLEERIEHNLAWMREFIQRYRLKLAPHGKTTMSPEFTRCSWSLAPGALHSRPRRRSMWRSSTACAK